MQLTSLFETAESKYGLPSGFLARTAELESGMNAFAQNPNSSAGGPFQFLDDTARQYGLSDKTDWRSSTDAAARLARDNAAVLRRGLGRDPSADELYLAHQQGAAGALRLLQNPDASTADMVGSAASRFNGGNGRSAGQFTAHWANKFNGNGGASAAPTGASPMALAYAEEPQGYMPVTNPGGLGGLGGFIASPVFANVLSAVGQSLLSSPNNAPLANAPGYLQAAQAQTMKRDELTMQRQSLKAAMMQAGIPEAQAEAYSRSEAAAKIALDSLKQQKQAAAGQNFSAGIERVLSPQAGADTPVPAPAPSIAPAPIAPGPTGQPMAASPPPGTQVQQPDGSPAAYDAGGTLRTPQGTPIRQSNPPAPVQVTSAAQNTPVTSPESPGTPPIARPAAPAASPQDQLVRSIPMLVRSAADPNLPDSQRQIANTLLTRALETSAPTADMKEYQYYSAGEIRAGRTPEAFTDWTRANKKSGATNIDMSQKADGEFEKKLADKAAGRWATYMDQADAAQARMADLNQMREISNRAGSQGMTANAKVMFGPYLEAAGISVDGLADAQVYDAMVKKLAPTLRQPGSGTTSDADLRGFTASIGTLSNNPEARTMILDTFEAASRNDIARGEIATKLANREITRTQAETDIRKLPDPLAAFRQFKKDNPELYNTAIREGYKKPEYKTPEAAPQASARPTGVPENARRAPDGKFYVPDPQRPGKFLQVQ